MQGKKYIEKMLDLLVDMANHCINKDKPEKDKGKCVDCALSWSFSLSNHGCFLVETIDYGEFIDNLENICIANDINYKERFNKLADIFVTEYE